MVFKGTVQTLGRLLTEISDMSKVLNVSVSIHFWLIAQLYYTPNVRSQPAFRSSFFPSSGGSGGSFSNDVYPNGSLCT